MFRTRRRWRRIALGLLLILAGLATFFGREVHDKGWVRATPTIAYIVFLPNLDSQTTFQELLNRVNEGRLYQWEYRLLVHRCIDALGKIDDPQRLIELSKMLHRIEVGGRNISRSKPWASWMLASEIDREGAINALVQLLDHEDLNVRLTAMRSLGQFLGAARSAIPALLGQLANDDEQIRREAYGTLLFIRPPGQTVLYFPSHQGFSPFYVYPPAPSELSFYAEVAACGADLRRALPLFLEGLRNSNPNIRATSVWALALLGENDADICARILDLSNDNNELVRRMVVSATSLFPLDERVRTTLDQAIDDSSVNVRLSALRVIRLRGIACNDYLDRVKDMLEEGEKNTLNLAARTFIRIGGDPETAIAALLDFLLDTRSNRLRIRTLETLGSLGVDSPTACKTIEPMLTSSKPDLQSAAAYAFVKLGGDSEVGTRAMIDAIRAEQKTGGKQSFWHISWIAQSGHMSIDVMIEMLHSEFPANRAFAARYLGEAGKHAAPTLPALKSLLTDSDPNVVSWVEEAVQRIEYELDE
ncbi:MAG: HEAT repeat domain-containing protein [Planctomycetes bacterium]|nr:HEAT repeat domain-containing protein [Planctomycetota bacterium]